MAMSRTSCALLLLFAVLAVSHVAATRHHGARRLLATSGVLHINYMFQGYLPDSNAKSLARWAEKVTKRELAPYAQDNHLKNALKYDAQQPRPIPTFVAVDPPYYGITVDVSGFKTRKQAEAAGATLSMDALAAAFNETEVYKASNSTLLSYSTSVTKK